MPSLVQAGAEPWLPLSAPESPALWWAQSIVAKQFPSEPQRQREPKRVVPLMLRAMMADAGDQERFETGVDRTGLMLSILSATTKIVDRKTGQVHIGKVPPYSVVVPGSLPDPHGVGPSLYCAVIVKTVDAQTRSKTGINELLRD